MTDYYRDYREITAKYRSVATCGHAVTTGDRIGITTGRSRTRGGPSARTQCADCWRRWSMENAEADLAEGNFPGYGW